MINQAHLLTVEMFLAAINTSPCMDVLSQKFLNALKTIVAENKNVLLIVRLCALKKYFITF